MKNHRLLLLAAFAIFVTDISSPTADAGSNSSGSPEPSKPPEIENTGDIENKCVCFTKNDVELELSENILNFVLGHIPLSVILARELGITRMRIVETDDGYLFSDQGFKVLLKSAKTQNRESNIKFSYSIGIDSPFPVKTTGMGLAVLKFKTGGEETAVLDIAFELFLNRSTFDKIAGKIPSLLEIFFLYKIEMLLEQAENLGGVIEDDPELIMETMEDADEVFSAADKMKIKELLKDGQSS